MKKGFVLAKMKLNWTITCLVIFIYMGFQCKKAEIHKPIQGTIQLQLTTHHHNIPVKGLRVYIKNDTEQFPGKDVSKYDSYVITDAEGKAQFNELFPGNHYLYAYGWDAYVADSVWGYKEAILNTATVKNNTISIGIPVSE